MASLALWVCIRCGAFAMEPIPYCRRCGAPVAMQFTESPRRGRRVTTPR